MISFFQKEGKKNQDKNDDGAKVVVVLELQKKAIYLRLSEAPFVCFNIFFYAINQFYTVVILKFHIE